jgi:hypothetical protein
MVEVTQVRDVQVRWHVMSLALLHEGRDVSPDYAARLETALGLTRVCAAAEVSHGGAALLPLYTALGTRLHQEKQTRDADTVTAALAEAGLPTALADAMTSTDYDEALRASHDDGISRVGGDVGTPILCLDGGPSIFGPVVSPIPRGEAAGRLWDGVALVLATDGFFELKRSRDRQPVFD